MHSLTTMATGEESIEIARHDKTLIVGTDLRGPGGVSHYYKAVLEHLTEHVDYMETGTRYEGARVPTVLRLTFDYLVFLFKAPRYDLIHLNPSLCLKCFLREAVFIFIAKCFRKKTVVFFRGWEKPFERQVETRWKFLFQHIYRHVDAMIVLADEFEKTLRRWGYIGPVYQETTTVDEKLLVGFDLSARQVDAKVFNVLFLARVEDAKGIYEAVDAVEQSNNQGVHFRIGGDGGAKNALEEYIHQKGYRLTEVCGYMRGEQKIAAYRQADVFLFPSYHGEGMPNSVLEAMAFGLPVITCPVGGLKDFFEDGKMGFLVPPKDAEAIKHALQKLMVDRNLCLEMSRYNAEYARDRFYSSRVGQRLENIYKDVLLNEGVCS